MRFLRAHARAAVSAREFVQGRVPSVHGCGLGDRRYLVDLMQPARRLGDRTAQGRVDSECCREIIHVES